MARVELINVTKSYDGHEPVVRDVNIVIEDREFVVLVGPSGCGKSTTLRMIAGLEEITKGGLFIDGMPMNNVPPKDRDIAMVFQNYALYPHMTVFDNMAFGLKLRKVDKKEIESRVREAAEMLGIGEYLKRKPAALSGGQRQRVALGRAIVRKPRVFLFDEPLSNLDAKFRVQMRAELSRLHKKLGATIVYVTHDQVEAMTMGDKLVVMNKGIIQQIDTPLRLYKYPANKFVAGFIGSPPMNFLYGSLTADCAEFMSAESSLTIPLPRVTQTAFQEASFSGRKGWLGVRPEDIHHLESPGITRFNITVIPDVIEPTGSDVNVYFRIGNSSFCARLPIKEMPRRGESTTLAVDTTAIHFFPESNGAE